MSGARDATAVPMVPNPQDWTGYRRRIDHRMLAEVIDLLASRLGRTFADQRH